jgi:hypothetical protein
VGAGHRMRGSREVASAPCETSETVLRRDGEMKGFFFTLIALAVITGRATFTLQHLGVSLTDECSERPNVRLQ